MSDTFNAQRLDVARRRRGLSKSALAAAIEVSPRMITAYESGEKSPAPLTVLRMAERLAFPEEFFYGDDLSEPSVDGTSFRAMSKLTARQRDQARGSAALGISLTDWVEERYDIPAPDVPQYEGVDAETAAVAVRGEWGLGERPIRNTIHTLEAHGVRVFSLPEECSSVDAFSFWHGETPFAFLNTVKSAEHRRMDAGHELGHLVLHHKGEAHGLEAEREAAQFGSAFLMPEASVRAQAPRTGSLADLIEAKKIWGVSVAALTYRMHSLGMLTAYQYRTLFMEISTRGYRKAEPMGMAPETSRLLVEILRAVRESGVTLPQLAKDLRLHLDDLSSLLFKLVLTPVSGSGEHGQSDAPRPQLRVV